MFLHWLLKTEEDNIGYDKLKMLAQCYFSYDFLVLVVYIVIVFCLFIIFSFIFS